MSSDPATGLRTWVGSTDPERFEAYHRWSLHLLVAAGPVVQGFLAITVAAPGTTGAVIRWGYLLVSLVQLVSTEVLFARGLDVYLGRQRWRRAHLGLPIASTGVLGLLGFGYLQLAPEAAAAAVTLPAATALVALSPVLTIRVLLLGVGGVLLLGLATYAVPAAEVELDGGRAVTVAVMLVAVAASFRVSVWMLGVVWEQERRREVDARLAVVEERLRFSRDLHDIFGRTLATVAVRSELAAELARRGEPRGAETMLEVRQLAQDALKEVRAVVEGYRRVDLDTELLGAQDILRSAGVRTTVHGPDQEVPAPAAEALGWVVREAVTNVVRHSDARSCDITVTLTTDQVGVQVDNDGVRSSGPASSAGSGLLGVAERLAALGGTLHSKSEDGQFRVTATIPREAGSR